MSTRPSNLGYSILSLRLSGFALNGSALGIRTSNLRYVNQNTIRVYVPCSHQAWLTLNIRPIHPLRDYTVLSIFYH